VASWLLGPQDTLPCVLISEVLTVTDVMCRLYCTVKALLRVQYGELAQGHVDKRLIQHKAEPSAVLGSRPMPENFFSYCMRVTVV